MIEPFHSQQKAYLSASFFAGKQLKKTMSSSQVTCLAFLRASWDRGIPPPTVVAVGGSLSLCCCTGAGAGAVLGGQPALPAQGVRDLHTSPLIPAWSVIIREVLFNLFFTYCS